MKFSKIGSPIVELIKKENLETHEVSVLIAGIATCLGVEKDVRELLLVAQTDEGWQQLVREVR